LSSQKTETVQKAKLFWRGKMKIWADNHNYIFRW
jgi:hypothetical protein